MSKDIALLEVVAILANIGTGLHRVADAMQASAVRGVETPKPEQPKPEEAKPEQPKPEQPKAEQTKPEPEDENASSDLFRKMESAVLQVKAKHGNTVGREILKNVAGTVSLQKVPPEKYQEVITECEKALSDEDVGEPAPVESVKPNDAPVEAEPVKPNDAPVEAEPVKPNDAPVEAEPVKPTDEDDEDDAPTDESNAPLNIAIMREQMDKALITLANAGEPKSPEREKWFKTAKSIIHSYGGVERKADIPDDRVEGVLIEAQRQVELMEEELSQSDL